MRVLISGSSGLIGRALCRRWEEAGHEVVRLSRDTDRNAPDVIAWSPRQGVQDIGMLEGFDAVVHLAGASIAPRPWTLARKRLLIGSRVPATQRLAEQLAECVHPPNVFLGASAIGYYGDRGDTPLDESARVGEGFLAALCQDWEAATAPLETSSRIVNLRTGLVLSRYGGALAAMLPFFRLCLGGRIGPGTQYVSFIALHDVCKAIDYLISNPTMSGPVNLTAPEPVTNAVFTKTLAKVLRRPAVLPVPAFALKMALGEMARESLLASARVLPVELRESGFTFSYPELGPAIEESLKRWPKKRRRK